MVAIAANRRVGITGNTSFRKRRPSSNFAGLGVVSQLREGLSTSAYVRGVLVERLMGAV